MQGHPKRGEERFCAQWLEDNAAASTLTAFSRPGMWWSSAVAPISRRLQ
ncbi:hypothetical protein CK505_02825 [Kocuria sp. WN036]|nr:hypothetical protein CK505_02825 [Kocuria sp. WN036]